MRADKASEYSVELVLVRSIGGKEYIDLQVGRRSWRREGAGRKRDTVVECRQEGGGKRKIKEKIGTRWRGEGRGGARVGRREDGEGGGRLEGRGQGRKEEG